MRPLGKGKKNGKFRIRGDIFPKGFRRVSYESSSSADTGPGGMAYPRKRMR